MGENRGTFPYYLCILILSLVGCSHFDFNTDAMLLSPVNEISPIQGTWEIEEFSPVKEQENRSGEIERYLGKTAMFDDVVCAMGEEKCVQPKYKIINVATADYFYNKFRIDQDQHHITAERVDVITVTSDHQVFYEFIKIEDSKLLVYMEGGFLYLHKTSDEVKEDMKQNVVEDDIKKNREHKGNNVSKVGLLLGIRSANNTYKTLWINMENNKLKPILTNKQLLVPRKTGFWEVGRSSSKESIYAMPMTNKGEPTILVENKNILTESPDSKILFVGNDYIGTENNLKLNVLPIDNISLGKGIKLTDVTSKNAYAIMLRSSEAFIASLDREKAQQIIKNPHEDNFTLERRSGHWIMKGRLFYDHAIGEKEYEDFNINILVPMKLINYDELYTPWGEIKSSMPWIIDAYQSPLQDTMILTSNESLYIYTLDDGKISNQPLREIGLQDGDTIVMAEWALGDYVDKWNAIVEENFTILN
ncbi:hypothetical protein [Bacillus sp. FSL K6-3431]|uniref:hypothetical protein n=1 Tax=Bacillus sp. FSL K6-3431 TaxID=2921500 RepID=UPI0030FC0385